MNIKLAENIKRFRTERGITQKEFAEALSVTPQSVSRWENGQAYPDTELLPAIASYFGVTLDELMVGQSLLFGQLLTEQRALEREMQVNPSPGVQRSLCDILEKIVRQKESNPYYMGHYFHQLLKLEHGYGGVSEKRIEQARDMFRQQLETAGIEARYQLLREVIQAEEEEKLILWRSYLQVPNQGRRDIEFSWDSFLLSRYQFRGQAERWETERQHVLFRLIGRTLLLLTSDRPEIPADKIKLYTFPSLQDVAHYETAMALLNTVSTREDDIFLNSRVGIELGYAGALFASGKKERGFEMLERVKEHTALLWDKAREKAILRGSVPFLSQVEEVYDMNYVMGVNVLGSVGFILGYDKRPEFDSVRNDDRFRTYISQMEYLTPMTRFAGHDAETLANLPDFEDSFAPMMELARGQLKDSNGTLKTQSVVLYTAAGNTYHVIEPNAMEGSPNTLRLLESMKTKGDCRIERCVVMWWRMGGEVDVPSYEVREKMVELDSGNRDTKILLCSGKGFVGCPLFKTGKFSQ